MFVLTQIHKMCVFMCARCPRERNVVQFNTGHARQNVTPSPEIGGDPFETNKERAHSCSVIIKLTPVTMTMASLELPKRDKHLDKPRRAVSSASTSVSLLMISHVDSLFSQSFMLKNNYLSSCYTLCIYSSLIRINESFLCISLFTPI